MEKEENKQTSTERISSVLEGELEEGARKFLERTEGEEIKVISHFDTDGITSASIMIQSLKRLDKKFTLEIVKRLDREFILELPKDKIILFLDLASNSLHHIIEAGLREVFIIDHHEIIQEIPKNVTIINPELNDKEKISSSGLVYLFCKQLDSRNKEFAKLAVLGMIGDSMEKNIDKLNNEIVNDGEIKRKRGLLLYPSTRPINRVLEYSSNPYIPGVTGNIEGVLDLLRETGLIAKNGKYKSLIELDEKEMEKLVTAIMLRNPQTKGKEIIGDIFLIKLFNHLQDAREVSAMINACSRLGKSGTAVQFCMELQEGKKTAEAMHVKYKQLIVSGLNLVSEIEKIEGKGFVIINAQDQIKDTIIGTIASILSNSAIYEEGTMITTMAHTSDEKIKVSARIVGSSGRNIRETLNTTIQEIGGEVGGHEFAAGCLLEKKDEERFIDLLKKNLEMELVKI